MFVKLSAGYILLEVFPSPSTTFIGIAFNRFSKSNKQKLL